MTARPARLLASAGDPPLDKPTEDEESLWRR